MIKYITGDLFANLPSPDEDKTVYIPHVVNDIPLWGSGFVIGIMKKWPEAKDNHYEYKVPLGECQYDQVAPNICLVNMCAQKGISWGNGKRPLQYGALVECMLEVRFAILNQGERHAKRSEIMTCKFGSKRSGGDWGLIESLIEEIWDGIPVTVFEYEEK